MPHLATCCIACDNRSLERQAAVLMPFVAERALGWSPVEITADWGLRDLPTGWAQAVCCTLHCPQCGMIFLDMRFDDAEMGRLYADYRGPSYEAQRERHEPGYTARNQRLVEGDAHIEAVEKLLKPWLPPHPSVLDWGGGSGINTPLRRYARLHHVFDISGTTLVPGAQKVESTDQLIASYDLIVLSNVLEHLPEPGPFPQVIANHMLTMKAQALLYVEAPFEVLMREARTDPSAWLAKRHWHEHVKFFSEDSLKRLLKSSGFQILSSKKIPCDRGAIQLAFVCALKQAQANT